jgi:hypothetical protein
MTKGSAASVGMDAARLERIGPAMQAYVDRGTYAGVSTIVARRGVLVHEGQYGFRDREAGLPMTHGDMPDTARAAIDQDVVRGPDHASLQQLPGGDANQRQGRRFAHRKRPWLCATRRASASM